MASYETAWAGHLDSVAKETKDDIVRVFVPAKAVFDNCVAMLVAQGVPREDAEVTVDVFYQSDLRGEESHGIRLLLYILGRIKAGGERAVAKIDTIMDRKAVALWDANASLAQVVAMRAMNLAMEKAKAFGIGVVGIRNANSLTSPKYYTLKAAEQNMLGVIYTNSPVRMLAPDGGRTPTVGNNPISVAAPAGEEPPFVLDMACTQVAMEKVFQKHEHGDPIPLGWALDKDGNDTTSAQAALESRLMLPFGGYKAIGLALAHEVMTSALMGGELFGGDSTGFIPFSGTLNASQYVSAINIDWFTPVETFKASVDEISRTVKASKLRPGVERVYMPGEKGYLEEKKRLAEGIPLTRKVIRQLQGWAVELGVPPLDV